jgi:hypothetical protein
MAFFSNGQTGETGWARVQRQDEAGKLYSESGDCSGRREHTCCDTETPHRIPREQSCARSNTADPSIRHQCITSSTHSAYVWCGSMHRQRQVFRGSGSYNSHPSGDATSDICADVHATTYGLRGTATISLLSFARSCYAQSIITSTSTSVLNASVADQHGWHENGPCRPCRCGSDSSPNGSSIRSAGRRSAGCVPAVSYANPGTEPGPRASLCFVTHGNSCQRRSWCDQD